MRWILTRFGSAGLAAWLAWSAFDLVALSPAFTALPSAYHATTHDPRLRAAADRLAALLVRPVVYVAHWTHRHGVR